MAHRVSAIFRDLMQPVPNVSLTPAEICVIACVAEASGDAQVLFERRDEVSEFASSVLLQADYCAACGHRRRYHDAGLGSCRFDECGCCCFFETKKENE